MLAKVNAGQVMRTEPYRSVTTDDVNIGIVTALVDENDQVFGVVGADITLANLRDYIAEYGTNQVLLSHIMAHRVLTGGSVRTGRGHVSR